MASTAVPRAARTGGAEAGRGRHETHHIASHRTVFTADAGCSPVGSVARDEACAVRCGHAGDRVAVWHKARAVPVNVEGQCGGDGSMAGQGGDGTAGDWPLGAATQRPGRGLADAAVVVCGGVVAARALAGVSSILAGGVRDNALGMEGYNYQGSAPGSSGIHSRAGCQAGGGGRRTWRLNELDRHRDRSVCVCVGATSSVQVLRSYKGLELDISTAASPSYPVVRLIES